VTEIPEHLLRRSRERRAALSGDATATEQATATTTESPTSASPVLASSGAPETQAGGGGGVAPRTPTVTQEPPPVPKSRLGATRVKTPFWMLPLIVALPLWGIVYLGAFGSHQPVSPNNPVVLGAAIFVNNCATCHGATGAGGVGPQLNGGEVLKEWPVLADHINWVHTGGAPYVGKTIGGLNIPVPANNVMPAFGMDHGGNLTNQQILDVVCYERVTFGGGPATSANCPATG